MSIFITFIYKLPNYPGTFYGKYCTDSILDNHEGLDAEIKKCLPEEIKNAQIGIISVSSHDNISIHSSSEEKKCFDFYCEKFTINYKTSLKIYMCGNLIENPLHLFTFIMPIYL